MFSTLSNRLRHPIRAIREPFGKAGLTVAICALVMAMVGGAYAAGGLTKSQVKQVRRIAKKYAGKPGVTGPAGAPGAPGTNGKAGAPGAAGVPGKSLAISNTASGCEEGGITVEVEGETATQEVCDGVEGEQGERGERGERGEPWTAGGTLPSGKTETGAWAFANFAGEAFVPISFTIPLAAPLNGSGFHVGAPGTSGCAVPSAGQPFTKPCQVHVIGTSGEELVYNEAAAEGEEQESPTCPGGAASPSADAGNLCVYIAGSPFGGKVNAIGDPSAPALGGGEVYGAGRTGAYLFLAGEDVLNGTWAVTAP